MLCGTSINDFALCSLTDKPAEIKPAIVEAEINTPLMQGEHAPDVRGDVRQESKEIDISVENKKVIEKTHQQQEPEISRAEVIPEQEKTSAQQNVGIDKASAPLQRDSSVSGQNDGGTTDGRKPKGNLVKAIAIAAGIILIMGGFFYYNNINSKKMEQVQKDLTQKEEKIKEETRRAEEAARKAETNRLQAEIERQKAEAAQAEAAREIAAKEAATRAEWI